MKYIDADLLRKEVEKRMHICNGIFERDSDIYFQGKAIAYKETLSFIDSLQQEQPEPPKIEITEYYYQKGVYEGLSQGRADALKILEEFMKRKADPVIVIKQQEQPEVDLEKPVPADLEEAAGEYAEKHGFRVPYDGSDNFYDDVDVKASKEGFIAGAKWQENKYQETIKLAEDHAFLAGADWQKEQMLKEAVPFYEIIKVVPPGPERDKVRIIIVKED